MSGLARSRVRLPEPPSPSPAEATEALAVLAAAFLSPAKPREPASRPPEPVRGVLVVGGDGRIRGADPSIERLWGGPSRGLIGRPAVELLVPQPVSDSPEPVELRRFDAPPLRVRALARPLSLDESENIVIAVIADGEAQREPTAQRYRALVEQIPAVVFTASLEGGLTDLYVGPQIEALLGYTQEEWLRSPVLWYERLHPDDRRALDREFARGCETGGPFRAECRFLARDGRVVWVHGEARLIPDERGRPVLVQGVAFDITETKRAEEVIRGSLREKELLLKEIHHRVKNNLQVTSSLLRLQQARVADDATKAVLRDSQDRIRSMALVHEMLYQSPDLSRVDFGAYVRSLLQQLFRSYPLEKTRVTHVVAIDDVFLGVDEAVPCALLVNELVANALKHAFPAGRSGRVQVGMAAENGMLRLNVTDDGIGLAREIDPRQTESLGLQLVRTLAAQLGGRLTIRRDRGTTFTVVFPRGGRP